MAEGPNSVGDPGAKLHSLGHRLLTCSQKQIYHLLANCYRYVKSKLQNGCNSRETRENLNLPSHWIHRLQDTPRPFRWVALCAFGPASEEFILFADAIRWNSPDEIDSWSYSSTLIFWSLGGSWCPIFHEMSSYISGPQTNITSVLLLTLSPKDSCPHVLPQPSAALHGCPSVEAPRGSHRLLLPKGPL